MGLKQVGIYSKDANGNDMGQTPTKLQLHGHIRHRFTIANNAKAVGSTPILTITSSFALYIPILHSIFLLLSIDTVILSMLTKRTGIDGNIVPLCNCAGT